MQPSQHSDDANLTDSTFELISTDGESQDGRYSESITDSLDIYPPTDEVRSLNGNETNQEADTDSEEYQSEQQSRSDSIRYAEEVLELPSTHSLRGTPPPPALDHVDGVELSIPSLRQSIEFTEPRDSLESTKISVSHTIQEPDHDETAAISAALGIDAPERMIIAVRQTMSNQCLSTQEPLRLLYVGSDAGKHDIILKISAAVLASSKAYRGGDVFGRSVNGLFNILPISGFGSTKVPDVQLTESSDYQIMVETCSSAEEFWSDSPDILDHKSFSITIDNDKMYTTTSFVEGETIEPAWDLPHVAIFYLSGNDNDEAKATRDAAWQFMTRHGRPSIFISNEPYCATDSLPEQWAHCIGEGSAHLCVEGRDPSRHIEVALPIDLRSFLNIDARQMNRNLAHLTGLREDIRGRNEDIQLSKRPRTRVFPDSWFASPTDLPLLVIAALITLSTIYLGILLPGLLLPSKDGAVATRQTGSFSGTQALSATCSLPKVPTVTIHVTSTDTITPRVHELSTAKVAAHLPFGGSLSDSIAAYLPAGGFLPDSIAAYLPTGGFLPDNIAAYLPTGSLLPDNLIAYLPAGGFLPDNLAAYLPSERFLPVKAAATAEAILETAQLRLVKAQIASKLWWLKIQGKQAEHDEYAAKAEPFIQQKTTQSQKKWAATENVPKKTPCKCGSLSWGRCAGLNGCGLKGKWKITG